MARPGLKTHRVRDGRHPLRHLIGVLLSRARGFADRLATRPEARATFYSAAAFTLGQVLRIVSNLIMTRLLVPEMFGVMAVVLAIQYTLALVSDLGVRQMVVQSKRGDEQDFLNTAWTLEILRSLLTATLCLALALGLWAAGQQGWLPSGSAWGAPELPVVLAAMVATVILNGLRSTRLMTAFRHLQLGKVSAIELLSQLAGVLVMVGWACVEPSIWALIAGAAVAAALGVVLSHVWLAGERNVLAWDASAAQEIFASGRWVMLSSATHSVATNIDRFLLAGIASAAFLGFYSLALNLIQMVEAMGNRIIADVAYPSLSTIVRKDREGFARHLARVRLPIDIGFLATSGFLFAASPAIVDLLYDDRYLEAGWIASLLSLSLVFTRYGLFPLAYLALGKAHYLALTSAVRLVATSVLFCAGYLVAGVDGAIVAFAFGSAAVMVTAFWINSRYRINDFAYELKVLPVWGGGYVLGLGAARVIGAMIA
jgi:O-antigen/teichoic acid export membrane protein